MSLQVQYRPKSLKTFIGNEAVVESLSAVLQRKNPPSAFLFTGMGGTGKTTIGRIVARMLKCKKTSFKELNSADDRGIDGIRKIINEMKYVPLDGGKKVMLLDECVTPDTEILTENGWEFIVKLEKATKVAQYQHENRQITFTKPTKHIKKHFKGDLVHITGKQTDILGTPSHEQPVFLRNNNTKRVTLGDWKVSLNHYLPIGGNSISGTKNLTATERFLIMAAADGCWVKPTTVSQPIQFQFSKQRKINSFLNIMKKGNFKYTKVKSTPQKGNIKKRQRFIVYFSPKVKKGLKFIKNIDLISGSWGKLFIEELLKWDGCVKKILYWSGTDVDDADYIQAICALSGITCNRTTQIDNRKTTYKDVHRITFIHNDVRGCQHLKKSFKEYDGDVVCVRVPHGNIVIRRNNKVSISGNCHMLTKVSQEALLKALEEPPKHIHFIVCTTNPEMLKQTFKRRCHAYELEPLKNSDLQKLLKRVLRKEGRINAVSSEVRDKISELADGSAGQALKLLDQVIDMDNTERAISTLQSAGTSESEVIDICRTLCHYNMPEKTKWVKIKKILKTYNGDGESARRPIAGYLSAILLNNGGDDIAYMLENFTEKNFFDSGKAGLVLACYKSVFIGEN